MLQSNMSNSVDIHAQLASIMEVFAKSALAEMSKVIDNDCAVLRTEISWRQQEIETLWRKLQFMESELRSARRADARQTNLRSVGTQASVTAPGERVSASDFVKTSLVRAEGPSEMEDKDPSVQSFILKSVDYLEDGTESLQIKEERAEEELWSSEGSGHHLSNDTKPCMIWDSPLTEEVSMIPTHREEAQSDRLHTGQAHHSEKLFPATTQDLTSQQHPGAESNLNGHHRGVTSATANGPTTSAHTRAPDKPQARETRLLPQPESNSDSQHKHAGVTNVPADPSAMPAAPLMQDSARCRECGKTFTTRCYLKIHQRIHSGERPFTCSLCGKRFYCNSHLISHQRSHTGEKPYSCEECGKSYSHLNSLKLHQRSHTDDIAFSYSSY